MRAHRVGCGILVVLALGCGPGTSAGVDAGGGDRDTGTIVGDGGAPVDTGLPPGDSGPPVDSGPPTDSGSPVDGGVMPEVCTGGVDEDGDFRTDCEDDDCWTLDACILADARTVAPGVVPCGDPIELDAAATRAACEAIGVPPFSEDPTECDAATTEVTALFFCDATGAVAALWIEERLETPRTTRMLSPRTFESTDYEHASIRDWEERVSGSGSSAGPGMSLHEGRIPTASGDTSGVQIISVRSVMPSDTISRLVGMYFITSIIDLDAGMSTDTRRVLRTGGLTISVPTL
jgi:hypothetical protein